MPWGDRDVGYNLQPALRLEQLCHDNATSTDCTFSSKRGYFRMAHHPYRVVRIGIGLLRGADQ